MKTKPRSYPVRLPHLIRHCSPGAIARTDDHLVVVMDISYWTDRNGKPAGAFIPYAEAVKSALDIEVKTLYAPPAARERDNGQVQGVCIPGLPFPRWYVCPDEKCGRLHWNPAKKSTSTKLRCTNERHGDSARAPVLEQVSWVMVHQDGYLADLDFHFVAHRDRRGKKCEDRTQLSIRATTESTEIVCQSPGCGARGRLEERMPIAYGRANKQPWLRESAEQTSEPAMAVKVNEPVLHIPITKSGLVVPPESRAIRGSVLDRLYQNSQLLREVETARGEYAKNTALKKAAADLRCSEKELSMAVEELEQGYPLYGNKFTSDNLLEREWGAFHEDLPDLDENEDFVPLDKTKELAGALANNHSLVTKHPALSHVDRLVSVQKLRKVEVLKGFFRVDAAEGRMVPPDIDESQDWLPGLELFGEGVFFSICEEALRGWEKQPQLKKYVDDITTRYCSINLRFEVDPEITPRFLLLHTLSHLLMRQLESIVGYPAASFQERIYSSTDQQQPMAGILIYISVPDLSGTLGGLARMAEPVNFLRLFTHALDSGKWCSLDPLCSEHDGQGPGLLNRSACHACCLVPDPSCTYGNVLLDRAMLNGSKRHCFSGFLQYSPEAR